MTAASVPKVPSAWSGRPYLTGPVRDEHRDMVNNTMNRYCLSRPLLAGAGVTVARLSCRVLARLGGQVADRVAHGFILPLPYGTRVDWLRNVLAAGGATITVGGDTFNVVGPEIVDAATAAPQLSPKRRRAFERFGINKFVRVTLAPSKG